MKKKTVESSLGIRTTEETARHIDELRKSLPSDSRYEFRRKAAVATSTEVTATERTDVSRVTTAAMDRDFEIVSPDGIDLTQYRLNPVVLFGHDQDKPIGKALWIKADGEGVLAKTQYIERPEKFVGEWLPDFVFSMVAADVLRGKSIGFLPLEVREPTEDEQAMNPGLQQVIAKSLLLEYSIVSVPSNPLALVESISKGQGLGHWNLEFVGKAKKRKPAPARPKINHEKALAEALSHIELDPKAITEAAMKRLAERWDV